ncbi:hypothetical protein RHMOL_Rhmol02G0150400 [Rhododendron molle]|nr:hypothetical protein RHMOL_Rhmol02G0150400 [Rhododendron molle]
MFLFVVDLCFVIPLSFCVSLSSLIAVYAVVICASLFLTSASSDPLLPQDHHQSAANLSFHSSVPYKPLLCLLSGFDFIFTCPKPREKSEELKVRLRKLEELAERKEVNDITQRMGTDELFSSYKDQLGDLQENNLTGQISDEISNRVSLILLLGLSTNLLHGGIPFSISKLKQLELL